MKNPVQTVSLSLTLGLVAALTGCGGLSPKSLQIQAVSESAESVTLSGSEAASLTQALLVAGVPRRLGDNGSAFAIANKISCEISGATAGNPVCTVSQFDGDLTVKGDNASAILQVLSAHGAEHGGAHTGLITAAATDVRCEFRQATVLSQATCTLTIDR